MSGPVLVHQRIGTEVVVKGCIPLVFVHDVDVIVVDAPIGFIDCALRAKGEEGGAHRYGQVDSRREVRKEGKCGREGEEESDG